MQITSPVLPTSVVQNSGVRIAGQKVLLGNFFIVEFVM